MCLAFLTLSQSLAILLAGAAAKFLYIDLTYTEPQSFLLYMPVILILTFIAYVAFHRMGMDDYEVLTAPTLNFGTIIGALGLSFLILLGGLYLFKAAEIYSRGWVLSWFVFSVIGVISVCLASSRVLRD